MEAALRCGGVPRSLRAGRALAVPDSSPRPACQPPPSLPLPPSHPTHPLPPSLSICAVLCPQDCVRCGHGREAGPRGVGARARPGRHQGGVGGDCAAPRGPPAQQGARDRQHRGGKRPRCGMVPLGPVAPGGRRRGRALPVLAPAALDSAWPLPPTRCAGNAKKLLKQVQEGEKDYHFIEVGAAWGCAAARLCCSVVTRGGVVRWGQPCGLRSRPFHVPPARPPTRHARHRSWPAPAAASAAAASRAARTRRSCRSARARCTSEGSWRGRRRAVEAGPRTPQPVDLTAAPPTPPRPTLNPRSVDERKVLRRSHENPVIQQLYDDFLEKPNSHKVGAGSGAAGKAGGRQDGGQSSNSARWLAGRAVCNCTPGKHSRARPSARRSDRAPVLPPACPAALQAHELLHTYYVPCGPEKFDINSPPVSCLRSAAAGGKEQGRRRPPAPAPAPARVVAAKQLERSSRAAAAASRHHIGSCVAGLPQRAPPRAPRSARWKRRPPASPTRLRPARHEPPVCALRRPAAHPPAHPAPHAPPCVLLPQPLTCAAVPLCLPAGGLHRPAGHLHPRPGL